MTRARVTLLAAVTALAACQCSPAGAPIAAQSAEPAWSFGGTLPGAQPLDDATARRLEAAWTARPRDYQPRTRHLNANGTPKFTNRLFLESSPYLKQHAHNPVNWFPWGEEAFEMAKKQGRPVLLSIGYSTCHWCHVMEEESFEDEAIAAYLNEHYVAIKVDREERPDLDAVYMAAVQTLTGRGGWPMTTWLTSDRLPFYGGTYFPPRDEGGRVGFLSLLQTMTTAYAEDRPKLVESAAALAKSLEKDLSATTTASLPGHEVEDRAAATYVERYDPVFGGEGRGTKFPSSLPLRFLLRQAQRTGDSRFLAMATVTLDKMASGGIYDHVAGGFHRYATDRMWLVPHFEKMLYDNALLTVTYLEAFRATGDLAYRRIAREIVDYVERDMTAPSGAFYSATDADSLDPTGKRVEGLFFTWTPDEIAGALDAERERLVTAQYAVSAKGNFEGRNILFAPRPLSQVAQELALPLPRAEELLASARSTLYDARKSRAAPIRDEKILAAWNGLMISALARASVDLGEPALATRAGRAADFVLRDMMQGGFLVRSFKDSPGNVEGYLDDYACVIAGLIDLFEATGEPRWLASAVRLQKTQNERFADVAGGGYFMTSDRHEKLLVREKPGYDGAEPSGNSIAAMNLLRLSEITGDARFRAQAEHTIRSLGAILESSPTSLSELLLALDFALAVPKTIVIVTGGARAEAAPFVDRMKKHLLPHAVVLITPESGVPGLAQLAPIVDSKIAIGGKATAYVCEHRTCALPTSDPDVFEKLLIAKGDDAAN